MGAEAIAEAEARAAAITAEANAAFRPKVDLPPRIEPRPFPKAPPRKARATAGQGEQKNTVSVQSETEGGAVAAPARVEPAKPAAPVRVVPALPVPGMLAKRPAARRAQSLKALSDIEPVSAEPVSAEPISAEPVSAEPVSADADSDEIEIPIDFTPEPVEAEAPDAAPAAMGAPVVAFGPASVPPSSANPDSGRFDLQQLMSAGPKSGPPSGKKGLGDADLFSLAGDLFSDSGVSGPSLAGPDLSALGKAGPSKPPPSARLLAPVAVGTAKEAAESHGVHPSVSPATLRRSDERRSRVLTPWLLLPVAAMGVAAFMVWSGRTPEPSGQTASALTSGSARTGEAEATAPARPASTQGGSTAGGADGAQAANGGTTSGDGSGSNAGSEATKTNDGAPGANAVWKPPPGSGTTTAPAATTTSPVASVTAPPATTTSATAPATTTTSPAAPAGGEFSASAAKASLRNAAGAAAGCPSDKPGVATVSITFAPSGRVTSSNVSGVFAGTTTGGCIASAMRRASVPPFEGGPVAVVWKVTLR
ncbi:MAG: hypothetical protein R3F14_23340 [Polyangiaceae bacterium]